MLRVLLELLSHEPLMGPALSYWERRTTGFGRTGFKDFQSSRLMNGGMEAKELHFT